MMKLALRPSNLRKKMTENQSSSYSLEKKMLEYEVIK